MKYNKLILIIILSVNALLSCSNRTKKDSNFIKTKTAETFFDVQNVEEDSISFTVFLKKFNSDSSFQNRHTRDTILCITTDYFDEPGSGSKRFINKDEILPLVIMAPKCSLTHEDVTLSYLFENNSYVVVLKGRETGYLQEFHFILDKGLGWYLTKIVDDSN
jgi:hypothetical protein